MVKATYQNTVFPPRHNSRTQTTLQTTNRKINPVLILRYVAKRQRKNKGDFLNLRDTQSRKTLSLQKKYFNMKKMKYFLTLFALLPLFSGATFAQNIVINEINYNSSPDFAVGDWIEFANAMDYEVDMSAWVFKDSDDQHSFSFPSGTVIPAGGYIVIARDSADFHSLFPDVSNCAGYFSFGLSNGGELLRLYDADNTPVDQVEYDDKDPWPTAADGDGPTLELTDVNADNALAENWAASSGHGTPGAQNSSVGIFPAKRQAFSFFPNPAINFLRINMPAQGMQLRIFDIQAKQVLFMENQNFIKIDALAKGRYFMQIRKDNMSYSGSFIKQ